ncbi:MAG: triacylglycerol lipase [Kiritimatiellia bacterium]|jgi:triacylglycerol lipase
MRFLETFLRSRGFTWVWAVGSGNGVLAERAEWLAARVERLCEESGSEQIDVVAHGLGGLVAAWYVRHSSGPLRVRRLVTMGTPWGGTRMAVFTRGALGRETMVGSSVLDDLSPCLASAVCIWGSHDPMVLPASSAVAEDAVAVYLSGAGHLDLLLSSRAFRAVRQALIQPEVETDT